jgi:lipopolysaccharide transport system ATP-binding protein
MAHITARDLVVEFPIYGAKSRSLKSRMIHAATGGRLATGAGENVVIRALNGASFEINEGDRVGIVGHNGSGKSTLLRVLVGAYEPVHGEIEVDGRIASMLSLTLGIDVEATGYENVFLRGALMGLKRAQIEAIAEEICEFSGLGEYIDMPMRTYSSGMYMRLAFAISTSVAADIVVMDEWLSAGDHAFAEKAQRRLTNLIDKAKILVLASHDEQLIRKSCSKILELDHGDMVRFESL